MDESKKVAVVMSTYNGAKYIKEQIDSILNQTYKNIELVIRDDGSKDDTVKIIESYQKKHSNIKLITGKNLGFIKSFFELLRLVESDYYAYADQDDVWMPNKIELAVEGLSKLDDTKPNLAFGNSEYYDENMNLIGEGDKHRKYSFRMALFACVTQGMTMTINKTTRDYIVKNPPKTCFFHDWWTYLICVGMGNIAYSDTTTVKYRRMKTNATVEGQGYLRLFMWRIKNLLMNDGIKDIKRQMINYKKTYYNELSDENKKELDLFSEEKYNFFRALRKTFYPKKLRARWVDSLMLRILFLIGVL